MARKSKYDAALEVLDRMATIAKNEALVPGDYISYRVVDEKLRDQGAICGGKHACLVGSWLIASGMSPFAVNRSYFDARESEFDLALADQDGWAARRPRARIARAALEEAAEWYLADAERQGKRKIGPKSIKQMRELFDNVGGGAGFQSKAERLFEHGDIEDRAEQLRLINAAKRTVRRWRREAGRAQVAA